MASVGGDLRKLITIPFASIDATLTDFPLTVYLNSSNYDFTKSKADGTDISFTDIGGTALKFERQEFSNALQMAVFHVKVPSVSSSVNTSIYMKYGDLSAIDTQDKVNVWDSNYAIVQHMGASLLDSTSNGNNGVATGTTVVDTEFGKARSFVNNTDKIVTALSNFPATSTTTDLLMIIPKQVNRAEWQSLTCDTATSTQHLFRLINGQSGGADVNKIKVAFKNANVYSYPSNTPVVLSELSILSASYDNNRIPVVKTFEDGINDGNASTESGIVPSSASLTFGKQPSATTRSYVGYMLGYRLSLNARSDAWIKAESLGLKNSLVTITDA